MVFLYSISQDLVLRIPTLAIHLDRQEKFEFSKETQLFPIAGLVAAELERQGSSTLNETGLEGVDSAANEFSPLKAMTERHHPRIVELIADAIDTTAEQVVEFELVPSLSFPQEGFADCNRFCLTSRSHVLVV